MAYLGASRDGLTLDQVPLRMRAASNPGGPGHEWVKRRYIEPETREQSSVTIRARLEDNRYIDQESYVKALSMISGAERDRLLKGDWAAADAGTSLNWRIQVTSFDAACAMVAAGLGVSIMPRAATTAFIRSLSLAAIPLNETWARRDLFLCVRSSGNLNSAAQLLLEHLQTTL